MPKIIIKNRKGQEIVVLLEEAENSKGLVFVAHGFGGSKGQPHIETFAQAFRDKNFTAVRFDATNSLGESFGRLEDATATNYFSDLEDVISWAKNQEWYQEPFVLAAHSLGGLCSLLYAKNHPEKVRAVAPISTVVSGKLFLESNFSSGELAKWKEKGIREWESGSQPGVIKKSKWAFAEDVKKYDALEKAGKLKIPVLLIVGDLDETTPVSQLKLLYEKLREPKELHIIQGAKHTFSEKEHLDEIRKIISDWIEKIYRNFQKHGKD